MISVFVDLLKVGCRWCDCPGDYGPPTAIYNRLDRWLQRSPGCNLLTEPDEAGVVTKSAAINSTYIKINHAACIVRLNGQLDASVGRSRRDWTTKNHALTDVIGRPYALMLTPGKVSDIKAAPALFER